MALIFKSWKHVNYITCAYYMYISNMYTLYTSKLSLYVCQALENRKEGNDQKSIQLPNTLRPRHQRKRRTHLKQRHHNQNATSRKPVGKFLSQKLAKHYPK